MVTLGIAAAIVLAGLVGYLGAVLWRSRKWKLPETDARD